MMSLTKLDRMKMVGGSIVMMVIAVLLTHCSSPCDMLSLDEYAKQQREADMAAAQALPANVKSVSGFHSFG